MQPSSAVPPGPVAGLTAALGSLAPYIVELLLPERVALHPDAVLRALGGASGAIDARRLPHGAFSLAYVGQPTMHLVSYADGDGDRAARMAALQQTWEWTDAKAAVARAGAVLVVTDAPGLPRQSRLALFQRLVRALVRELPVLAIHWVPSQRVVDPVAYVEADPRHPLRHGPVNVRAFRVLGGAPDEMVMDTLGLSAFGLRDLQVCVADDRLAQVAGWLYEASRLVFARGDFMKDRDTVDGVEGDLWRCHHAAAAVGPSRDVVDFRHAIPAHAELPDGVRCPACGWSPDASARWACGCGFMWNTFDTRGVCPSCEKQHRETACFACRERTSHERWYSAAE